MVMDLNNSSFLDVNGVKLMYEITALRSVDQLASILTLSINPILYKQTKLCPWKN